MSRLFKKYFKPLGHVLTSFQSNDLQCLLTSSNNSLGSDTCIHYIHAQVFGCLYEIFLITLKMFKVFVLVQTVLPLIVDDPWPTIIQEATGLCVEDLNRCAFHMHEKW